MGRPDRMSDVTFARAALERLLRPRSVAIVGASPTPGSLGAAVLANLERAGYDGAIHLINPKRQEIAGRPCLPSPEQLPLGVDVAVLAIPRAGVLEAVQQLATRKVGAVIVFSAGFAEGGERGLADQRELVRIARANNMSVEGPNCLGLVNFVDGVPLTFVEQPSKRLAQPGIGIVSQSGAMAAVIGVNLAARDLGVSFSISTGNEAVTGVEDYLEYLIDDPNTRVIGLVVEQFRAPSRVLAAARRAREACKPIVLLHPGRSVAARASAATHTGAMAGDYDVMRAKVQRAGIVVAANLEELCDVLDLAMRCVALPQGGAGVITDSGVFKALMLDLCEEIGLGLPVLTDGSAPRLREVMPEFIPVSNPLDLTAQALVDPQLYHRTLAAMLSDERLGSVVLGIIQTDKATSDIKFPAIIGALRALRPGKPVVFAGLDEGAVVPAAYVDELRALGISYFPSPDRAFRALARLGALVGRDSSGVDPSPIKTGAPLPDGTVAEHKAKTILRPLGIPFPAGRFVTNLEAAQAAAQEIGYPVVLKGQAAELSHKSDAGGVIVGLADAKALAEGWSQLLGNIAKFRPGLELEGVLVEAMAKRGTEFIIGARNDPEWGPVILAGFGGVTAEILHDVRLLSPGLTNDEIIRELNLLKQAPLLHGFRGSPPLDLVAVAEIITRVGRLMTGEPSIRELDLNPVVVYPAGEGAMALDALILVERST
jgi:acyl-CoA synthetase (NDP forming)